LYKYSVNSTGLRRMLALTKGSLDGTQLYDQLHKEYREINEEAHFMLISVLQGGERHSKSSIMKSIYLFDSALVRE
jgi:hypothetical protein